MQVIDHKQLFASLLDPDRIDEMEHNQADREKFSRPRSRRVNRLAGALENRKVVLLVGLKPIYRELWGEE